VAIEEFPLAIKEGEGGGGEGAEAAGEIRGRDALAVEVGNGRAARQVQLDRAVLPGKVGDDGRVLEDGTFHFAAARTVGQGEGDGQLAAFGPGGLGFGPQVIGFPGEKRRRPGRGLRLPGARQGRGQGGKGGEEGSEKGSLAQPAQGS